MIGVDIKVQDLWASEYDFCAFVSRRLDFIYPSLDGQSTVDEASNPVDTHHALHIPTVPARPAQTPIHGMKYKTTPNHSC